MRQPRTGHSSRVYPSADHAARWEGGVSAGRIEAHHVLEWLRHEVGIETVE